MSDAERMILKMLSEGKITVEESERLLNAMKKGDNNENSGYTRRVYDDEDDEPRKKRKASPQDFINPFIQATKLGFDLRNIAHTVQQTVQQTVKKVEPRSRELKDKMKEFGTWMQDVVDTMATEITSTRGEPTDSEDVDFTVAAPDGVENCRKISIENVFGEVRITSGEEFHLHVIGRISRSALEDEKPWHWFSKNGMRLDGNELHIGFDNSKSIQAVMDMEFVLPKGITLDCKTVSGEIKIKGDINIRDIQTVSGNIKLFGCSLQHAMLDTVSGTVQIDESDGKAELHSTSGDFLVKKTNIKGLKVVSVSGDVMITESKIASDDEIKITTTSGDIIAERIKGNWSVIEAVSRNGEITLDWNGNLSDIPGGNSLNSGNPGAVIKVESVSGDIQFN